MSNLLKFQTFFLTIGDLFYYLSFVNRDCIMCCSNGGSNTALHLCALIDRPECMKLLLRSGADPTLRNQQDKTPLDIAKEKGHHTCEELVSIEPLTTYFLQKI